jgi:hypothetical protein
MPAREWNEPGGRDIDHTTRGARVREREAIESKLSELRRDPDFIEHVRVPQCIRLACEKHH